MDKKKLLRLYAAHQGLHWSIVGIAIPVLILIFQSRGLSLQEIGYVMAVWVGSTACFEIPLGGVADKYGRKVTYMASLVINIIGCVVLYYAVSIELLLAAAFFLGAARAVYSGTLDAWFYDSFQAAIGGLSYHSALAKLNVVVTFGLATGALVGGWLPDYASASLVEQTTSIYDLNIIVIICANTLLLIATWLMIKEQRSKPEAASHEHSTNVIRQGLNVVRESMTHDVLKRLMQTTFVYGLVLSSIENFWQPYLSDILGNGGYSVSIFGVITALYFLVSGISSLASVYVLKMFGGSHRTLMFTTRLLSGIALALLANTSSVQAFACIYLMFFFLFTIGNNSDRVLLNDNTLQEQRSTMLSVSSFIVTSGAVVASLALGYVSEHYGVSINWMLCGGLLVATSVLFVMIPSRSDSVEI